MTDEGPVEGGAAYSRLEDQLGWYDRQSGRCQRRFKWLKGWQLVAAAVIPVAAALSAPGAVSAALAGVVLLLEGFQQMNQYQQNWINYRATAEALKHEKFLFLARADVYSETEDPQRLLAERTEGLVSQEHARWVSARRDVGSRTAG